MAENRNQEEMNRGENGMNDYGAERSQQPASSERKQGSRRGFAAMDPARQREIARQGGRAAHTQGVAHQWTSEEAREAGRKGGQNSRGGGRRSGTENA